MRLQRFWMERGDHGLLAPEMGEHLALDLGQFLEDCGLVAAASHGAQEAVGDLHHAAMVQIKRGDAGLQAVRPTDKRCAGGQVEGNVGFDTGPFPLLWRDRAPRRHARTSAASCRG